MIVAIAAMLPAAAGVFAVAAIVLSWLRYGPVIRSLRDELGACDTTREMRYVVITTRVAGSGDEADGFRLAERLGNYQPIHRQARRPALRAAA